MSSNPTPLAPPVIAGDDPPNSTTLTVVASVAGGLLLVGVMAVLCVRRRRQVLEQMAAFRELMRFKEEVEARQMTQRQPEVDVEEGKKSDGWEITRQMVDIEYNKRLGQGAFGNVYLGKVLSASLPQFEGRSLLQISALKMNHDLVAVKMLHETADRSAELAFLDEIELMKKIGYHERLVNMIACVTSTEPPLLITEFCCSGDLLKFMRDRREFMHELDRRETDYASLTEEEKSMVISQKQQIQYAVQIAYGLEYLSHRGFVHRDIAARNILVDKNDSCKIGDFGLCRKVEEEQELYLSRGGRLPLKWMSPEALRRYEMSTASDVWSFGVLLFEIVTLGGSPYPDWAPAEILPRLEKGERMVKPDSCPDSIFMLMMQCWDQDPRKRPDFTYLRKECAKALEQLSPEEYYLKLDYSKNYYSVSPEQDEPVPEEDILMIPD